ncbi:MAG: hypothetical protein AB9836_13570 [Aminipila sp.]
MGVFKGDDDKKQDKYLKIAVTVGVIAVAVLAVIIMKSTLDDDMAVSAINTNSEKNAVIAEADKLALGYFYDEALEILQKDPTLIDEDVTGDAIKLKIADIQKQKDSLIKYEGVVEHVFFHSLIVYPELAFDKKGHPAQGYNMWMTTVKEFKAMLPELYKRGYVLYPLNETIKVNDDGSIIPKDIYLPKGKKPLVISIDDVNYYDYMKPDGFANRLVMGPDKRVWTEVINPKGEAQLTRDGDVMPILDDFVVKHPDFSWKGAKGVIALTGYEGALGYRITDNLPEEAKWQQEVKALADNLKADGWLFACHSYTHNGYFRTGKVTMAQMKYDTDRWKQKIEPWVGKTNIYISPFGWHWDNNNSIHRYIADSGYKIFCPVDISRKTIFYKDMMVMPRVNLDGYTMQKRPDFVKQYYYDVNKVYDLSRPEVNY